MTEESAQEQSSIRPGPERCDGRYILLEEIGAGGMAKVYAAHDCARDRRVALKRLSPRGDSAAHIERCKELFEREFRTLAELSHPRIVEAYEYGFDGDRPYYTMELLDGGDLHDRTPLPWREACAIAFDVCSALSLVHSRHMVYRDLSSRNVRCTTDGKAKLLDFGAMAPMGQVQAAVCTPAVAAPEVVYNQALDARTDLYALGSSLYATLVGHSPYPARNFRQLPALWTTRLSPPSAVVEDLPEELDALIEDLLQLDAQARPTSAAEVAERLRAIAKLEVDEHVLVSRSYLTTPTLVGRAEERAVVDDMLKRLRRRRRGDGLLIRAASGLGRTRFLDACVLSARVHGLAAARVSGSETATTRYGAIEVIVDQLLEQLWDEVRAVAAADAPIYRSLFPRLVGRLVPQDTPLAADLEDEGQFGAALRRLVSTLAEQVPIVLAIDNIESCDPDSKALLTLLTHHARKSPLIVVATTTDQDNLDETTHLLQQACKVVQLKPLNDAQAKELLASIFGDVPNLTALVFRVQQLAAGNPRDIMRLSQHLLAHGVVRHEDGVFVLPENLTEEDLPGSVTQALVSAVAELDGDTRALAQAFAFCPNQHFSHDECLMLTAHRDPQRLYGSLSKLLVTSIAVATGDGFSLRSSTWIPALREKVHSQVHVRLAALFQARGDGLRAARHCFATGRDREGVDCIVEHSVSSYEDTSGSQDRYFDYLRSLPVDWKELYDRGLELARQQGRSAKEIHAITNRLGGAYSQFDRCNDGLQAQMAKAIARDAGLDILAELDPSLPAAERLRTALQLAAKRYQETPEDERVFAPGDALAQLARTTISAIGEFSRNLDVEQWAQMPSLAPVRQLSPALDATCLLAEGFEARATAHFERACETYRHTLARLDDQDSESLGATFVDAIRGALPAIIGVMEAALGLEDAEAQAQAAERGGVLYQGSAMAIRMLSRLFLGDVAAADRLTRERELWRLEQTHSVRQSSDTVMLFWTMVAHAASDDLTRARHNLEAIERAAGRMHTWTPIARWARGEYDRIRGDYGAALTALDQSLAGMPAGKHQAWPFVAGARLRVMCHLKREDEVCADGERYLKVAAEQGLGYVANFIRMPLARAYAAVGNAEMAHAHARAALESFQALGTRGLFMGLAHEAAAEVAFILGDEAAHAEHSEICGEYFTAAANPALLAKYHRLTRRSRKHDAHEGRVSEEADEGKLSASLLESVLQHCKGRADRLQRGLELLVDAVGAKGAYLYTIIEGEPVLAAQTVSEPPPPDVEERSRRYLQEEVADASLTMAGDEEPSVSTGTWNTSMGMDGHPVLLSHYDAKNFIVSGLAVLLTDQGQPPPSVPAAVRGLSRYMVEAGDLYGTVVCA
ncbi:MAG: protein kinase [Myxococcales bacterium]|nr:protein kinase [Myxococcales bacterium]